MLATTAIVWPTSLSVDEYAAAGRDVVILRQNCPDCAKPMIFWSWYSRTVRDSDDRRIWVRRCRCMACAVSHALLPAFCLLRRLYSVEVIGPAVAAIVAGGATHQVAEAAGFPYTTTRDWRRRHRDRASTLAASLRCPWSSGRSFPGWRRWPSERRWKPSAVRGPRPGPASARGWRGCGGSGAS